MGKKKYKKWQIFNCYFLVVEFSFLKVRVASCTLKSKKKMLLIRSTNLIRKQKLVTFLISYAQFWAMPSTIY